MNDEDSRGLVDNNTNQDGRAKFTSRHTAVGAVAKQRRYGPSTGVVAVKT